MDAGAARETSRKAPKWLQDIQLLRSYAADAAEAASGSASRYAVSAEQARDFIVDVTKSGKKTENRSGVGSSLRLESKSTVSYTLRAPAGAAAGKADGRVLHQNVLRKEP